MTTTTGAVVMLRPGQLTEATLTDEEAARCVRPASQKDYVQARIDGAIRFSFDGREFKNRYTCADGTERRQFEVTATGARCALCPDARTWSLETDFWGLLANLKNHCGQWSDRNQSPHGSIAPRAAASAAAAPPVATADEAGIRCWASLVPRRAGLRQLPRPAASSSERCCRADAEANVGLIADDNADDVDRLAHPTPRLRP